jgi:predicted ATPase
MARYQEKLAAGLLQKDPRQEVAMAKLDELCHRIQHYTPAGKQAAAAAPAASGGGGGGGFFGGLFGGSKKTPAVPKKEPAAPKPTGPRGLYLWGGTGTGKTFMMDIFHDAAPVEKKRRIHFHEWMIDVNVRLNRLQKGRAAKGASADDLVAQVAAEMMSEAWLLCFDEFQVTHISDAIIMKRIFSVLFERGAVVVATSNRPPEDLYLNGLNRSLFLPFIPMLKDFCEVHDIGAAVDYRLISTADGEDDLRVYISPNGDEEKELLERKWQRICKGDVLPNSQLEAQGRKIAVPRAAVHSHVAWFGFADLCDRPLGAADYLAVAAAFHTVFIADVPKLTLQERDQVRRFITLIDALYDHQTKVILTADRDPISLFEVTEAERRDGTFDEVFAWDRTVSRLTEMQSTKYLSESARSMTSGDFLGQYNVRSLTEEDMKEMWVRYDNDDSGELDMKELRLMLEDMMEKQRGHRNLTDDAFDACADMIDANKDGNVSYDEFEAYLKDYSLVSSSLRDSRNAPA